MNKILSNDLLYYFLAVLTIPIGLSIIYTGKKVDFASEALYQVGFGIMFVGIVLIFARNFWYLVESSDPENWRD